MSDRPAVPRDDSWREAARAAVVACTPAFAVAMVVVVWALLGPREALLAGAMIGGLIKLGW